MDTRVFLQVERFVRVTSWAHGFLRAVALFGGVTALGTLVAVCWGLGRGRSSTAPVRWPGVTTALWTVAGAALAAGLGGALSHLVGRAPPFRTLEGVDVLVPRPGGFSFPDQGACIAGAAMVGITAFGRNLITVLAWLAGLVWAFAQVYVGVAFPSDAIAGLLLGGLVAGVLRPAGLFILDPVVELAGKTPLRPLVARRKAGQGAGG